MSININSMYGTEETWKTFETYFTTLATFDGDYATEYFKHTLGAGIMNGTITKTPDTSICPIAVDSQCSLVNVRAVRYADNTIQEYSNTASSTPLMFISTARGNSDNTVCETFVNSTLDNSANNPVESEEVRTVYGQSNFPMIITSMSQPIVEFSYKKIVWLICVSAVTDVASGIASITADVKNYDLESYVRDGYNTHPHVLCVFLQPYIYDNERINFSNTNSDNGQITGVQSSTNFGIIPIGSVNSFNIPANESLTKCTYLYSRHFFKNTSLNTWNFNTNATLNANGALSGIQLVIGGYDSTYASNLFNQTNHFIMVYGNEFFVNSDITRGDRLYAYWDVDDIDTFKEWCLKQTAYTGMYFSSSYREINDGENFYTKDTTYMGIIDNEGITHGEYAQGEDILNYPQSQWDSLKNQSPFDYTKKPDNSVYDTETKLNTDRTIPVGMSFTHNYACNYAQIQELKNFLYNTIAPDSTTETLSQKFLTVNPIDCVISVMQFPLDMTQFIGTEENIVLGNVTFTINNTAVSAHALKDSLFILDYGDVEYYAKFGDFRDYSPYSECLLYIPYVAYVPLDTNEYIGHNIGVKVILDIITGACQALIFRDGLVMQAVNGTMGTQVKITGIQTADYINAVHRASTNYTSSLLSVAINGGITAVSAGTGNIAGAVMGGIATTKGMIDMFNKEYELDHVKVPFKVSGTSSPAMSYENEQICRLILKRPIMDNGYSATTYADTVGFACCINGKVSDFTGYSVFSSVDMSGFNAPEYDKQKILSILQSGIYI